MKCKCGKNTEVFRGKTTLRGKNYRPKLYTCNYCNLTFSQLIVHIPVKQRETND